MIPFSAMTLPLDNRRYERYTPSPGHLFADVFEPLPLRKRVRYLLSWWHGSVVFYMKLDDQTLAYCLLEPGGGRYPFLSKRDWVVSPYIVREDMRGLGIGTLLLQDIRTHRLLDDGRDVYAFVRKNNIPSLRAMDKAGWRVFAHARNAGLQRKYLLAPEPEAGYLVFLANGEVK